MNPPYDITPVILKLITSISQKTGEVNARLLIKQNPILRKQTQIKTIHSSLKIEGNTLSEEQITAIIENKRVTMTQNLTNFFLILLIFLLVNNVTYSQNVAINDNGSLPNSKAILDIQSTDKGILIPNVLLVDNNNPISGVKPLGLMVWNDNQSFKGGKGFYFWNGNIWQGIIYYAGEAISIDSNNKIGTLYNSINQSGIVPAPTLLNKNATYITDSKGNPKWKTEDKTMYYINKF